MKDNDNEVCTGREIEVLEAILNYLQWLDLSPPVYRISLEAFKRLTTVEMTGNLNESLNTWAGETIVQTDCSVEDFKKRLTEQIPLLRAFVNIESGRLEALMTILSKSEILEERTCDSNSFREGFER